MDSSYRYIAQDRRRALAQGSPLPRQADGAALVADIAGFTALTARMAADMGARRGTDELAARIDSVYEALVEAIEVHAGCVVGFAGDALICWFDGAADGTGRATRAAHAMQAAMACFEGMALRIGIGAGPVLRLVAGDPDIQLLDTLAGRAVSRMAQALARASAGEIVVHEAASEEAAAAPAPGAMRGGALPLAGSGGGSERVRRPRRLPSHPQRPWLLPAVREAERLGHGAFLMELRPCAAVFIGFDGLDFEQALHLESQLDDVVRRIQQVAQRHEGALLQLTIDDKGAYAYACFGAPLAHEDDRMRAVRAAWQIREALRPCKSLTGVRMGVAAGIARAGAYGSARRATYGALGDHVNVAARLMAAAGPGQILLAAALRVPAEREFELETPTAVLLKGQARRELAFPLAAPAVRRLLRLDQSVAGQPMVGRQGELRQAGGVLDDALQGRSRVLAVTGEAGIGKSRFVAALVALAQSKGFDALTGACSASMTATPYHAWKPIVQALLEVPEGALGDAALAATERRLAALAPHRTGALPVLAPLLDTSIAESGLTRALGAEDRAVLASAVMEDLLRGAAAHRPLLVVLEDLHWVDPTSRSLLKRWSHWRPGVPLCLVLVSREQRPVIDSDSTVELTSLSPELSCDMVRTRLAEDGLAAGQAERLTVVLNSRAEGNPFYLGELLNFLRDRKLLQADPEHLDRDLPDSLQALILARIDRLSDSERATLKAASVIGREFRARWLAGYHPGLGGYPCVVARLARLHRQDITILGERQPDRTCLFKHVLTRDVAYAILPHALQATLHRDLARYIELELKSNDLDLIAYHFGQSDDRDKQREYFAKAGHAAEKAYANEAALIYFERLLPLLETPEERFDIQRRRAALLRALARNIEARDAAQAALALAMSGLGAFHQASAAELLSECHAQLGEFEQAYACIDRALSLRQGERDAPREAQALVQRCRVLKHEVKCAEVEEAAGRALGLARQSGMAAVEGEALGLLAWARFKGGDRRQGQALQEGALESMRASGDLRATATALVDLIFMLAVQGKLEAAGRAHAECLEIARRIGHRDLDSAAAMRLGTAFGVRGDYEEARDYLAQAAAAFKASNARAHLGQALYFLGCIQYELGEEENSEHSYLQAIALYREMGVGSPTLGACLQGLGTLYAKSGRAEEALAPMQEGFSLVSSSSDAVVMPSALQGVAELLVVQADARDAVRLLACADRLAREGGWHEARSHGEVNDFVVGAGRDRLGQQDVDTCWKEGLRLTLEEALDLAHRAMGVKAPAEIAAQCADP
jgi:predicted ATPase/class 3 adenylate cyclase